MSTPDALFDLREYTNGTGIGRYARSLAQQLSKQSPADSLNLAYLTNGQKPAWANTVFETTSPTISIHEQFTVPWKARDVPLLHVPFLNVPITYAGELILTVHDFTLVDFMEAIPNLHGRIYAWAMTQFSIRRADRIIAISNYTKKEITSRFPAAEDKISVIHNGISPQFSPEKDEEKIRRTLDAYGISEPYIFSLGSNSPHKNFRQLVEAFQSIHHNHQDVSLVLAGNNVEWETELGRFIESIDQTGQIQLAGFVDESDIISLYTGAEVFTLVSLNEGFGFPPLEAMACHTPCVVSNLSSLPEVTGDAAIHVDPRNPEEIASMIGAVLDDDDLSNEMIKAGIEQSQKFTWEKCARQTIQVYCDALS